MSNMVLLAWIATMGTWLIMAFGAATVVFFSKSKAEIPESDAGLRGRGDDRRKLLIAASAGN